ncbi:hypothetical protein HPB48_007987 [Haemaphysalis longicornis]|uniref:Uncharacterized protein n=1 Tax=Haemaphysalis longicornis TaxID=44386 RepID=A0A9J6GMZ3_HAELO|nr:hypothetical protein HPB48_007987 [Haemaphysalis longicornis]
MKDRELRWALNSHLPDDSQLWPNHEVIDMQPGLFAALDKTFLLSENNRAKFVQYLGAYMVWLLSPIASDYLASSLLDDLGYSGPYFGVRYKLRRVAEDCFYNIYALLPAASWKLQADLTPGRHYGHRVLSMVKKSMIEMMAAYSEAFAAKAKPIISLLGLNVLNMSISDELLDSIYDFVPVSDLQQGYYSLYRAVARAVVAQHKQSLRSPRDSFVHLTGVSAQRVYRLLVTREVIMPYSYMAPPMADPGHPIAVVVAAIGNSLGEHMLTLLQLVFLSDERFQAYSWDRNSEEIAPLREDIDKFALLLRRYAPAKQLTLTEVEDMARRSMAADAAFLALADLPAGSEACEEESRVTAFLKFDLDRLFFILTCYTKCGATGRQLLLQASMALWPPYLGRLRENKIGCDVHIMIVVIMS